jgi:hypothetical protein
LLSDERYLWYRPTMAALRALKKIADADGCGRQKLVAAPHQWRGLLSLSCDNFAQQKGQPKSQANN